MDRKDVINKVFPHSLFGYDPIAVDAFLDEVIREFDRLNNTVDVLQFRLAHELGDAYHQNDLLSRELEYAKFGRRVNDLLAAAAEKQLPGDAAENTAVKQLADEAADKAVDKTVDETVDEAVDEAFDEAADYKEESE